MKKKLLSLAICIVMLTFVVYGLVACDGNTNDGTTYDITVWVGEGTKTLTEQQIDKFNETNEWGVKFNATVEIVSESKAAGDAISKQQSAADIFCFAQDQLARLVQSGLLAPLNSTSVSEIQANNDAESVTAATIGSTVRAFPMTADNGYFMYYDKSVISEEHIGSLEAIIADCESAGRYFSMNLTEDGGSWYAASFFYATGCVSEWETDENGNFTGYVDTFKSDEGVIALRGMQQLLKSSSYRASGEASDFNAAIPSAAVISGIWDYNTAKSALGDNFGIAPLPSFNVDGTDYQLVSYLGRKLMGVKQQSDAYKALYLQKLAIYLTSEECQFQRFEEVAWGPSNKALQSNSAVTASPALAVLSQTKTVLQGQYPANWWSKVELATGNARSANDVATLQNILETYYNSLASLIVA